MYNYDYIQRTPNKLWNNRKKRNNHLQILNVPAKFLTQSSGI